ncbi:MAG TPA: sugar ABC transporter ATP-binding protein [Terriglobia bacterium]
MTPILEILEVSKSFPGVKALQSIQFEAAPGEVVALVGENGAGKSTLMKILAGIHQPDSGSIRIDGAPVEIRSPRDAARLGIAVIHQELELVETLDVAGNIFLGREFTWRAAPFIDKNRMWLEAGKILQQLNAPISPRARISELPLAHKQLVEIARALSLNAKILLMDEPTSSLTAAEAENLMRITGELKASGVCIIYISHRLSEIRRIADRVIVLRDGKNAGELRAGEITHDRMIRLMVGRDLTPSSHAAASTPQPGGFEIRQFRTSAYPEAEISLIAYAGEILGITGLVGAGRSELARAIFGVDRPVSGTLFREGAPLKIDSVRDAIGAGIYLVPEDRRSLGLITSMTVRENITLPAMRRYSSGGLIRRAAENRGAKKACEALRIKTPSLETAAASLSGGNQQKVVLAKWLSLDPKLLLFDEPTRGVDVGAKAEIYQLMRELAGRGAAIIMISSDMEEILGNSDRVAVMREGQITGVLDRAQLSEEAIMRLAVA